MTPSGKRNYRVACLAGHGVGPEVMAEASRAVAAVSRHHGFAVEETHVPFGGEALSRSGHHLPAETRAAYVAADAVLVAAAEEPALTGVVAELDLRTRVTRVRATGQADVSVLSPLADDAAEWTVERAFQTAVAGSASLVSVASDSGWSSLVERVSARYDGVLVEHLGVADAVPAPGLRRGVGGRRGHDACARRRSRRHRCIERARTLRHRSRPPGSGARGLLAW